MGYLDELSRIFGEGAFGDNDVVDSGAVCVDGDPLQIAREQLGGERTGYHEGPEGTFTAGGARYGVGYAEAVAVVDPATGLATVDINSGLRFSPQNVKGARKLFRRLNQGFIIPGLTVDDEGFMHFCPEEPVRLLEGDDLTEYLGKGFSTVHAHAHMVAQIEAGRAPWDVLQANAKDDDDDDEPLGALEALRRLMA